MGKKNSVKESPQEKLLAERAAQQFDDWQTRWKPVQQALIGTITESGKVGSTARTKAAGLSNVENQIRFSGAAQQLEGALAEAGGGMGSSKAKLTGSEFGGSQAASRGAAFGASDQAIDDAYVAGLGSIMSLGRGEKAGAQAGAANAAQAAGAQALQDANQSLERSMGKAQLYGQLAGVGLGAAMGGKDKPDTGFGSVPGGYTSGDGSRVNNPSAYTAPNYATDYAIAPAFGGGSPGGLKNVSPW